MDSVFRQRLVGTLVLVALGVVFWPIIFVEPMENRPIELQPVPARPSIDRTAIPTPTSPEDRVRRSVPEPERDVAKQSQADEQTQLPDESGQLGIDALANADAVVELTLQDDPPVAPSLDASGYAQGWVLQVATVSSQDRAAHLVEQLVNKGYPAFAARFERESAIWWRVQIGPKLEKSSFESMKVEVDEVLKVESMIVKYEQPS